MSTRTFTEEEVQDLTDRVFLLKEHLEAGKMHFATKELSDGFFQSYEAIQLRPDGKVEPTSVDGRIRASTLALMAMRQREAVKNELSLAQIQQIYFDFLFREFGWLYEMMKKAGASPSESAEVLLRNDDMWQRLSKVLPEMVDVVREFWKGTGEAAGYHLQDGQQLKAVFAGDVFPAHWENAVSTAGLYVDTIILPCPLTRLGALLKASASRKIVTVVVKHILTAMTYKDIALADVDPPIAMIVPNRDDPSDDERSSLVLRAVPAICAHAKYLFGRTFDGVDDLQEFCLHLKTVDQVMKELKGPDRLIFDTEWGSSPSQQLSRAMIEHAYLPGMAEEPHAGLQIFNTSLGRMPQALGAQEASLHFRGTPYINAETSWLHFTWLLEYQGVPASDSLAHRQSMHVVRALTSEANNNLEWLGNVPPETVLEIRKRGLAGELRELLGHGVSDLIGINQDNYFRTADQVVSNLDEAFRRHQQSLRDARHKKLKLYGIDVGACVATGAVAVAAALTGNATLGAVSGVMGVAGLPNLRDIKTKLTELSAQEKARRESPTGLLFRHVR
ncbi:hypothetical protein [Comamonas sp. E6]|uniref:hypothetical protein n=2 Tax=Comamonas TaxID=283 RepID=UPI0006398322|nr:hypothetical protein [Comamonas sp. E6]GAO68585.1 hypothetical protein CSE6_001_00220 [Comamonas sp. E6]